MLTFGLSFEVRQIWRALNYWTVGDWLTQIEFRTRTVAGGFVGAEIVLIGYWLAFRSRVAGWSAIAVATLGIILGYSYRYWCPV
jgi:hypothetical protein